MSRCGYSDDNDDPLALGRWRAQVESALRGKRGQKFLRDLVTALDAMPQKNLVAGDLQNAEGAVCALGALGKHRGVNIEELDTEDYDQLGTAFDIAHQLAQETMYVNDEYRGGRRTPGDERWQTVRDWAAHNIKLTPEELPEVANA